MARLTLFAWLCALVVACKDEAPPPPPLPPKPSASVAATPTAKTSGQPRRADRVEHDIKILKAQLAGLNKRASRTFAKDAANKINVQIAQREKRLAELEAELAAAKANE